MVYFYKEKFPKINDLVHVIISEINELNVYCTLSEYNDIQGMILISELSKRKNQNTNKLVKIGKKEILLVLKVDPDNGYIDLSKKRVTLDDYTEFIEKYSNRLVVNQIITNVHNKTNKNITDLYSEFVWGQETPLKHLKNVLDNDIQEQVTLFFKEKKLKLKSEVLIYCYCPDGIDIIKRVLLQNLKENQRISIKLIAAPNFEITIISNEIKKQDDTLILKKFIHKIKNELNDLGASLTIEKEINEFKY